MASAALGVAGQRQERQARAATMGSGARQGPPGAGLGNCF